MDIYLYGEVRAGSAQEVLHQLQLSGRGPVRVHINSSGGDVSEGLAIYSALNAHPGKVTTKIDGFALSIASLIAMAGDTVMMSRAALLMLHDPWSTVEGNAAELERMTAALEKIASVMVQGYSRTGIKPEQLREMMRRETWLTSDEALEMGFIDEISDAMPIAANFDLSHFRNVPLEKVKHMNTVSAAQIQTPAALPAANAQAAAPGSEAEFQARLNSRNGEITAVFAQFRDRPGVAAIEREVLANASLSADAARNRLLTHLGNQAEPLNGGFAASLPRVSQSGNLSEFLEAASDVLLQRAGFRIAKPHAAARDISGMSLASMAETCLKHQGVRIGDSSPANIFKIAASHTTSDFPGLLANTAGKALMKGFEEEPASHRVWVGTTDVRDFKEQSRVAISEAPALLKVGEGGEFTQGTFGERKETYSLETFGRYFTITRQALVNDDLSAFTRMPKAFGAAAARLEANMVYDILTTNPVMSDSVALFHATHKNLAASGAAISVTSLGAAKAAMRKQQGVKDLGFLNLVPRYLIVPAALETVAESLLNSLTRPDATASGVQNPEWIRSLQLVVDPRLDASSATAWYLAASSNQVDTIEIAYLQGQRGIFFEEKEGFMIDGVTFKARLDFQAAPIDWRGMFKNPGA